MSDEKFAFVTARAIYANYTITMVVIGIHIFMALYGLSAFLETPEHLKKGRKRYIAISFMITTMATLSASLDMSWYFEIIWGPSPVRYFSNTLDGSWNNWKPMVSNIAVAIVIFVGDSLLVYRCYVVCVDRWWAAIFPGLMTVAVLVIFFAKICFNPTADTRWATVATSLTIATNIFVTTLITYRLIRARRRLTKLTPMQDTRLYTGAVAILIESAAPLSIFGIPTAILETTGRKATTNREAYTVSYMILSGLFYAFCTLSPHMIIFRVTTGRSWTKFPSERENSSLQGQPIQFNPTAESSFLQTSLSSSTHHCGENPQNARKNGRVGGERSGGSILEA